MNRTGRRWGRLSVLQLAVLASSTPAFAGPRERKALQSFPPHKSGKRLWERRSATIRISRIDTKRTEPLWVPVWKRNKQQMEIVKDTLCITDKSDELCYAVWVKGREVKLVYENSDLILEGTIK